MEIDCLTESVSFDSKMFSGKKSGYLAVSMHFLHVSYQYIRGGQWFSGRGLT